MAAPANRRLITEARLFDGGGIIKEALLPEELGLTEAEVAAIIGASAFEPDGVILTPNAEVDALTVTYGGSGTEYIGSATWDPGSLNTGVAATTTVTVTGALPGDTVVATHSSVETAGTAWILTGYVSSSNTVTVVLLNVTGGTVNLASGTLRVRVFKQ